MAARWQREKAAIPDYYTGPLYRPSRTGLDRPEHIAWDQMDTWQTTAEWLSWVRRRDERKIMWDGKRWCYPMRPIIRAHRQPWFTRKMRVLP